MHIFKRGWNRFRGWSKKRKAAAIGLLLVVGLIGYNWWSASNQVPEYKTEFPVRQTLIETVSETGNVQTANRVDIYTASTGIVTTLLVDNGDLVTKGQELFRVQSTATEEQQADAYAAYLAKVSSLNSAEQSKQTLQSNLESARKAVLDRQDAVDDLEEQIIYRNRHNPATGTSYTDLEIESIKSALTSARQTFDAVEKQYLEADAAIQAARAAQTAAWFDYQSTRDSVVKATSSGRVFNLGIKQGDTVVASNTTPVMIIGNLDEVVLKVNLNELDVPKVTAEQPVEIEIDAVDNRLFNGMVSRVDDLGAYNQGVVTYGVYIRFTEFDEAIKPGMTATATITVETKENVLTVSSSAVRPYQGARAVQRWNSETQELEYIPVVTGIRGDGKTEIVEGLDEDIEIITALSNEQVLRKPRGPFGR